MANFDKIVLGWSMGTDYSLFTDAVMVAKDNDCTVSFEFNGGTFVVGKKQYVE